MKKLNNRKVDVSKALDQLAKDKEFIVTKIREGKKHELKGKFKFVKPI
jgi:hypothetical protein